jgi:large subunit ribosomal protein L11
MAKQIVDALINGGKASAAPPLGPALGPLGVNIGLVVAEINKKTEAFKGMQVPVKVEVDTETKAFTISIGTPPASGLLKQESGIQKGSGKPSQDFVANLTIEQIIKVASMKEDASLEKHSKIV